MTSSDVDVAIIGAGISGLVCGQTLQRAGLRVQIWEKSRGVGGRMATRRTSADFSTDHGAQYFTVRDPAFQTMFDRWQRAGIVAPWRAKIVEIKDGTIVADKSGSPRYVGVPGMSSICRSLAEDLAVVFETRIVAPRRVAEMWELYDENEQLVTRARNVVCTAPAPQTADLLQSAPALAAKAREVEMEICWTVVFCLEVGLNLPYGGAFINDSELAWIACNSSKPERPNSPEVWVLHASADWSREHQNDSPDNVERELLTIFQRETGRCPAAISRSWTHRWLYAKPTKELDTRFLFDDHTRIGACGDWCDGPRVEGAFQSGLALANHILDLR